MWVMKYECKCIENMEWLESLKKCIHSEQRAATTLMLPKMIDWIDEIMKVITFNTQTIK